MKTLSICRQQAIRILGLSKIGYLELYVRMGRYKKEDSEGPKSSEDYLSHIDLKLGLSIGTVYSLCQKARTSRISERTECRVTYRGLTRSVGNRAGPSGSATKEIFLIESEGGVGRKVLAQVFLSMPDTRQTKIGRI